MSFLSVLKKIGQKINGGNEQVQVYGALAQIVAAATPGTTDDRIVAIANDGLVRFQNIIVDAEVFGQALSLPGTQKAEMAAPALIQLLMDLPILKGKKPEDPVQTKADAAALAGAMAKFYNGYKG